MILNLDAIFVGIKKWYWRWSCWCPCRLCRSTRTPVVKKKVKRVYDIGFYGQARQGLYCTVCKESYEVDEKHICRILPNNHGLISGCVDCGTFYGEFPGGVGHT